MFDDGYSGVTFDRPGVQALLSAAMRGQVDCIIVKDFTRFTGTNYYVGINKLCIL